MERDFEIAARCASPRSLSLSTLGHDMNEIEQILQAGRRWPDESHSTPQPEEIDHAAAQLSFSFPESFNFGEKKPLIILVKCFAKI